MRNWTKLRGLTLHLSDFLLVLCGRILLGRFRALDSSWKTTLKALGVKPQFSQQFFMGNWTEPMMPELLQNWLTLYSTDFEQTSSQVGSTTLSGGFYANRGV